MNGTHASARIALVTGGSSGSGTAICTELAARGWRVLAANRRATAPVAAQGGAGVVEPVVRRGMA